MKKIILFMIAAISFMMAEQTILVNNQEVPIKNLREIVENAARSSQRVFVEDFTGLQ
ncbi:MAG: hypothetical protein ISR83_03005 [Candidatus Marinimicrobia bacterium]|nr:hypothetical protein [Candidatus Neomarinimicrobiota bacterium]